MGRIQTVFGATLFSDEARWVKQAKSGDSEAFAQLYEANVDRVYRYILFRVSEREVEDLVSQVFLKAWQNLARYKPGRSPFLAWLYTIARNLVIDHYRAQKAVVPLEAAVALPSSRKSPDDEVQDRFDLEELREALRKLSEDQQQALILKYLVQMPNKQIARILKKKEGTVRGLQMRGLQNLARHMKEKEWI